MLEIDRLTFRYPGGDTEFSFEMSIQAGEIVGLVGPSGAGKSTLFDLIAGFLDPASGDIRLNGASILARPPEERPVSILFQADNVFDHLSAGANVALGLGGRARADDRRVIEALDRMDLPGLASRRADRLSGGQKQRVALARTLLRNRPILLLDEPFTGLDPQTIIPIRDLIARLVRENGWHAIIVSHQAEDVAALAAKTYRIEGGRTVAA
ncbi:ATP-binding cassette domain-containing protein [Pelagibacterium sp. 26DY04]|uniref:ATP-binding cassette domain-containing protein n=1 Tax=Pelagibacterium sp. 26DY04 TaxID=2967130 RepID=UPI002814B696|nr:ATP-binding cassette domain-containing protein [Pelagibacterium sp. 26DY04]WMT86266.1 ATP-binding cassette domain-containing protein [Pelagibacterium sp. 26DY04]